MVVESVSVLDFRNLATCEVELGPGLNLFWGANGAGKTNLLEATYTALAGRSCRTRDDRETIAFGQSLARAEATVAAGGWRADVPRLDQPRRRAAPPRRRHPAGRERRAAARACRVHAGPLALVKGPPAGRRAHLDGFCAALWPARGEIRRRYSRALAQRNALLGRIRAGAAGTRLSTPGTGARAAGVELIAVRAEAVERCAAGLRGGDRRALGLAARRRSSTGRAARQARRVARGRVRRAPRRRHRSRLHRIGPAPRRARARAAARRCAATAPRASSEPRCWHSCSPSASRCSRTAARRR